MTGRMAGRSALITGAASGIGAAVAELFHTEGATVMLTDVADAAGSALAERLGDRATYRHLDVTSEEGWTSVVDELTSSGAWTTLVTSAGAALRSPLADTSVDELRRILDLNVIGTFLGVRAAARSMTGPGASIVTIGSLRGLEATTGLGAYGASKAAVTLMARVAALEVAGQGIRVNTICPGSIATPITDRPDFDGTDWSAYVASIPLARRGTADEVASAALFLASDDSAYVTGTELVIDGGTAAGRTTPVS
ncbi:SDR family NAD(P)-dependent oxidoreductase [Aeromicrobium ginsengisoli]|uniref:SDR family oxidoreductase n=1 Tax=Aeromicrobium ginsengisoli TaxID=363867 RepID=A0A5M4FFL6_9ACTN|nr:SDR family oxidoreductase [Aeromicrobium ginsengisoli]KAA1397631.1 SDR family oxidoreductase [Aeromicrobium ginsengisoli]